MDYNNQDIIIARATPIGSSAIAVIRLSGLKLLHLISSSININKISPNKAIVVHLKKHDSNEIIDKCVLVYFKSPKSFTGEDTLEISCHGGEGIVNSILSNFIELGARLALPGEFSYRGVQNNKIDVLQAEAIAEKINKTSTNYNTGINKVESGATSKKLKKIKSQIQHIMMVIEHELDFNEDEVTHIGYENIKKELVHINETLKSSLNYSIKLQQNIAGYSVAILGHPNTGKSTLFNNIIGDDKAIVTNIKGTTRDVLEAQLIIEGVPFIFYDTAGIRKTKNKIEEIGIEKGMAIANKASILLIIDDYDPKLMIKELKFVHNIKQKKIIFIKTKQDTTVSSKPVKKNNNYFMKISAHHNIGLNSLLNLLLTIIEDREHNINVPDLIACNTRQTSLLKKGANCMSDILKNLNNKTEMDIIASQCREFIEITEELLGKTTSQEMLNNIFEGFCVGK